MSEILYNTFVSYYLRDKNCVKTDREFRAELKKSALKREAAAKQARHNDEEISGYEHLKALYTGTKKPFDGNVASDFSVTFVQLKEFIRQSLEEFSVLFSEKIAGYGVGAVPLFCLHVPLHAYAWLLG